MEIASSLLETSGLTKYTSFDNMKFKDDILRGIYSYGFEKPSEIQQYAITPIGKGKDFIIQAPSGTGKTSALCMGVLKRINFEKQATQVLIISPTRELSNQTSTLMLYLGEYVGMVVNNSIGGSGVSMNKRKLKELPHVVIGTPGRVIQMGNEGALDLQQIKTIIFDDGDQIQADSIIELLSRVSSSAQIGFVCTTLSEKTLEKFLSLTKKPVQILCNNQHLIPKTLKQFYILYEDENKKYSALATFLDKVNFSQCIIFCNSARCVDMLTEKLKKDTFPAYSFHGNYPQEERDKTLRDYRSAKCRLLVSTDILAKGIDLVQTDLIVNYELPSSKDLYVHRVGRTSRFGRKGISIALISQNLQEKIQDIENTYGIHLEVVDKDLRNVF